MSEKDKLILLEHVITATPSQRYFSLTQNTFEIFSVFLFNKYSEYVIVRDIALTLSRLTRV